MGRFSGTLLCTDFDGTLAGPDGKVSPKNLEAIRWFQSEGGLFTIASGRSPDFLQAVTSEIQPNAPIMTLNGGMIVHHHGFYILDRCILNKEILSVIEELCLNETCQVDLWHKEGECLRWKRKEGGSLREAFAQAQPPFYKAVLIEDDPQQAVALRRHALDKYGSRFLFERSWPFGLEILPGEGGKGAALDRIRKHCPGAVRVVGMGDYENDVSLVREADFGIAVGNALACVKEAADAVTVSNDLDPVWHVIHELL